MTNRKKLSKEIPERARYSFKPTSDITLHELAEILDIKIGYLYYNKLPPSLQKHFKRDNS